MINVTDITFHYKGQRSPVFDGFNLQIEQNRIYGLLGKNGTGKSTLLYLLSGLLRPDKGTVTCDAVNASARRPEFLRECYLVAEEFDLPRITLKEYVSLNSPFYPHFSREVLDSCLHDFELSPDIRLDELSMGQRKKAYMSFALATQTKYLFMDEPTNGLDIPSKTQFRKVVAQNMTAGRTVVISTHQVHDVEQLLDHILILDQRRVLLDTAVEDITRQYTFEYRSPQAMDSSVLYAEPTLQGNAVITRRQEGAPETQVNLELLFNYITQSKP